MKAPLGILALLALVLTPALLPTAAEAHGHHVQACLASLAGAEPVEKDDLGTRHPACLSRQGEIYLILRGGAPVRNEELRTHLWRLAGSLAAKDWTPPQVQVRVIVQNPSTLD
jgi:hypothetical protein